MNYTPTFRLSLPLFDYEPWDGEVNGNFTLLDALVNTVVGVPGFSGLWLNSKPYSVGQVLVDGTEGSLWKCLVPHTSTAAPTTFTQDRLLHPTYWDLNRDSATGSAEDAQASADDAADQAQASADSAVEAADQAAASASSAADAAASAATAVAQLNKSVLKAGDTMTGLLVLSGDPAAPLNPVTRQYGAAQYVSKFGSTMMGTLTLVGDPNAAMDAATKQYVDMRTGSSLSDAPNDSKAYSRYNSTWVEVVRKTGGTYTGIVTLSGDPVGALDAVTKQYSDTKLNTTSGDARYLKLTGGTLSGALTLNYVSPSIVLNGTASGQDRILFGQTAGKNRWSLQLGNGSAEGGSNAGSDFFINRYNDAGTYIDGPLNINRATGNVSVPNSLYVTNTVQGGYVYSTGDMRATGVVWSDGSAGGRIISKGSNSNPSVCVWDNGQGYAMGMFLAGGTQLYFGSMDGGGGYTGNWFGRFDTSGNFWSRASTTCTWLHSTGDIQVDGWAYVNGNLRTGGGLQTWNFYGNRVEFGWDSSGYGEFRVRFDGGNNFMYSRGNIQITQLEGGNMVWYWNGGYGYIAIQAWGSDRRLKSNIEPAGDALAVINRMQVHSATVRRTEFFTNKEDARQPLDKVEREEQWPFTLIADELDDVLPLARARAPEPLSTPDGDTPAAYDQINGYPIVCALVRGMQQLTERVSALEGRA